MRVNLPVEIDCKPTFTGNREHYYRCLARAMRRLHEAVKERKEEIKQQDKEIYDKANRVKMPTLEVGQKVWLRDTGVQPGSNIVLTRQRFHGPYIIQNVVKNSPNIGEAYKLVREKDGRPLKFLVNSDRLKRCDTDRKRFNERLPRLYDETVIRAKKPEDAKAQKHDEVENDSEFEEALEIIDIKTVNGKKQYLVRFLDGSIHLCDAVTDALLRYYMSAVKRVKKWRRRHEKIARMYNGR